MDKEVVWGQSEIASAVRRSKEEEKEWSAEKGEGKDWWVLEI